MKKTENLNLDEKLDKIMEAVVFQQQLLITSLKVMDSILTSQVTKSKIIKPNG